VNRFIEHLQMVTTNIYNTVSDFHTTNHPTLSSQAAFISLYLVTTLNNGYSSAVFTLVTNLNSGDSSTSVFVQLSTG
jgi:hypothetical protein